MDVPFRTLGEELMPTKVSILEEEIKELKLNLEMAKHRHPRTDWSRTWQSVSVLISICTLVFVLGSWWRQTDNLDKRITSVEQSIPGNLGQRITGLESLVQQLVKQQSDQKTDSAIMLQQITSIAANVSEIKGAQTRSTSGR